VYVGEERVLTTSQEYELMRYFTRSCDVLLDLVQIWATYVTIIIFIIRNTAVLLTYLLITLCGTHG